MSNESEKETAWSTLDSRRHYCDYTGGHLGFIESGDEDKDMKKIVKLSKFLKENNIQFLCARCHNQLRPGINGNLKKEGYLT